MLKNTMVPLICIDTRLCRKHLEGAVLCSPSLFGRLMAISELRDPTTGRYEHIPTAAAYGTGTVDRTLRRMHRELFADWLSLPLVEQERDIRNWVDWLGRSRDEGLMLLRSVGGRLSTLVPREDAFGPGRILFMIDSEIVLCLICGGSVTVELENSEIREVFQAKMTDRRDGHLYHELKAAGCSVCCSKNLNMVPPGTLRSSLEHGLPQGSPFVEGFSNSR